MNAPNLLERRRVTLVDDEPCALDVLVRAARSWDFDCQAARSAEAAIELLEKNPTPIVVTDLRMPGNGGVWLVQEVQKRWPETAVIVITAGEDEDAMAQCLQAGAHQYFLKPIKLDEFQHALQATLRGYYLRWEKELYRQHLESTVARKARKIKKTFFSAINSLVRTLEARDPYTSGHSMRVRSLVVRLAERLQLPTNVCKRLGLSAKLHDIGKVGMAEGILNKPDALTPEELGNVRDHPVIGERIMAPILRSRDVLDGIRHHHERYDGTGYPDKLAGGQIPLFARLIAIADCYDALTSCRAYRGELTEATALEILIKGAGTQFDPYFVRVFVEMIRGG